MPRPGRWSDLPLVPRKFASLTSSALEVVGSRIRRIDDVRRPRYAKGTTMNEDGNRAGDAPVIACNLLGRELAERKDEITRDLFAHVERVDELPDGFAYRFPAAEPWAVRVFDF